MADLLLDFLQKETPKVPYIVGRGILPVGGKCIIGGQPKANKSWVALAFALAIVRGRPVFGATLADGRPLVPVPKARRVLYVEQELGEEGLKERFLGKEREDGTRTGGLLTMADATGLPLFVKSRDLGMRLDTDEGRAIIRREIEQVQPDVVIFDPLSKFNLSDENSAQEMGAVLRAGDHLIQEFNCAIIYIHHISKQNPENPKKGGDRLRGSSAIFADVDTYVDVQRMSASNHPEPVLELNFELRRGEPMEAMFVRRMRDGRVEYLGETYTWSRTATESNRRTRGVPYAGL